MFAILQFSYSTSLFINLIQTIYLGYNVEISVTFSLKIHSQIHQSFYSRALYVVKTVLVVRHINGNVRFSRIVVGFVILVYQCRRNISVSATEGDGLSDCLVQLGPVPRPLGQQRPCHGPVTGQGGHWRAVIIYNKFTSIWASCQCT